jgi:sulfur dioxygenase
VILRQLFDLATSTFTYLLADESSKQAVLIDCVFEQHLRDLALVRELDLHLAFCLETHVHADHVTGAWLMKRALGSRIALAAAAGARGCDRELHPGETFDVGSVRIEVRATPGHTDGCLSYVVPEARSVFTGDALLIRGAGRTDFQRGDSHRLFHSVREQLFTLPLDYVVYPGHDYSGRCSSTIAEERRHNPRLGDGVREEDFVGYMAHLGLPHPKRIAEAVPANLQCGQPDDSSALAPPDWGPVIRTFAGVWQVEPEWVYSHRTALVIVDVREEAEVRSSPLGKVEGSVSLPLSTLRNDLTKLPPDRPVVLLCATGARSAMAASLLESAGIGRVANVRGGVTEWRALGLPLGS